MNIWEDDNIPPSTRDLLAILTVTAKSVIVWHRKRSGNLLIEDLYSKLWDFFIMEKITYRLDALGGTCSSSLFTARWLTLLDLLKGKSEIPAQYDYLDFTLFKLFFDL